MLYWALFEGRTPFNTLWLSFDKWAELDLRLTNKIVEQAIFISCQYVLVSCSILGNNQTKNPGVVAERSKLLAY